MSGTSSPQTDVMPNIEMNAIAQQLSGTVIIAANNHTEDVFEGFRKRPGYLTWLYDDNSADIQNLSAPEIGSSRSIYVISSKPITDLCKTVCSAAMTIAYCWPKAKLILHL
jgi:hypothetical protein